MFYKEILHSIKAFMQKTKYIYKTWWKISQIDLNLGNAHSEYTKQKWMGKMIQMLDLVEQIFFDKSIIISMICIAQSTSKSKQYYATYHLFVGSILSNLHAE